MTSFVSQILRDELFISSGRNIYSLCRMEVAADTLKTMVPQLVSHGLPTIDTLNSNSGICIHATITIKRTLNNTHGSACGRAVGQGTLVGEAKEKYKTDFKNVRKDQKLQIECKDIETSLSPLDSTTVGAKISGEKTPVKYSSARKEK